MTSRTIDLYDTFGGRRLILERVLRTPVCTKSGVNGKGGGTVETKAYVLGALFGDHPQALLEHVPHCRDLSMVALHAGPHEVTLKIPFDPSLVGDPARGVVFGGVITTLLDHGGGIAVMCSLGEPRSVATIDLRIDYMRPAAPGRDLIGYACCYKVTRHVAFVTGAAYHDDRDDPFAKFQSTYMLGKALTVDSEALKGWAAEEGGARSEGEEGGG